MHNEQIIYLFSRHFLWISYGINRHGHLKSFSISLFLFPQIPDPYRWLENPDSVETKQFVDDENQLSQSFISDCDVWKKINEKLMNISNYPKYWVPERYGNYYISSINTGLQNQEYEFLPNSFCLLIIWFSRMNFGNGNFCRKIVFYTSSVRWMMNPVKCYWI